MLSISMMRSATTFKAMIDTIGTRSAVKASVREGLHTGGRGNTGEERLPLSV